MGVEQDAKGFIWIATLNGLQRYDGRRFLTFQHIPGDASSIPDDGVYWLHMDKKNRLWLKCRENRMGYFNTDDFTFHEVPVRYPEMPLRDADSRFMKDKDGNLMLLLEKKAILTYNEATGDFDSKHNPFQLPSKWGPYGITQDHNNDYWIACDSGLVKYSVKEKLLSYRGHNATNDPIISIHADARNTSTPCFDKSGRFWLLSWPPAAASRLYSYELATKKLIDWDPNLGKILKGGYHETYALNVQHDGTTWVYGGGLFAKFNERKQTFELVESNLPGEFSIRYDGVRNLFEDKEHNVWIATNKGLYRFNPEAQFLRTVPNRRVHEDTVYTPDVTDIIQLKNGDILASTWGNGIFPYDKEFNPVKRDYIDQGMKLGEGMVWCIHERANGDIWRGNQDGYLLIYHADKKTSEKIQPPVFRKWTIRQITEDKDGNLWLGTHGGHLVKWDAATNSFSLQQKFGSIIFRLYTDRQGDIWACTRSHGVFRVDHKDGHVIHNYTADGPKEQRLMLTSTADIIQYDDSTYIIASGCLNILNIRNNSIHYLGSAQGLPSNTVSNIVKDRRGELWLTLESGLCSILIKNIDKGGVVSTYNENDGLPTVSFNNAATGVLNDGRIVMGTSHEMMAFDPAQVERIDLTPPTVMISGFSLQNKWLLVDSLLKLPQISLKPGENSIVIEFSTLTFQNIYGISYMLENLDKTWVRKAANQFQAIYNYLPPGHYTFKVRCENGDGTYSEKITELKIVVEPPFWKTWWFFCLLALAVAAVIYWLDKQRVNKLLALQKVRTEIAGNLHEEVNTTLNNINLLSEMARIKADKDIDRSKEYIDQISSKSHNMINAMDDILWSIDPDNDNMEKSLLRMMEFADALKNRHGATVEIALDKKVRSLKPDMKTRHEVFLIFKQALKMIIEYSEGKKTLVHIDLFKNKLSVKLQDATASLDKNIADIDESIKDMNARSALIGGDLDVQYDKNGIAVVLLVPVK
jgi:ligand-binding sensor domain-containing protein/signal transduction histidine kinase